MAKRADEIWEKWYPLGLGLAHFCVTGAITFWTDIRIPEQYFQQRELWTPLFAIAAGATGIIFSVFVFIMAPAAGFVERISKLDIFQKFRGFVQHALLTTVVSTLLIYPLISASEGQFDAPWFIWVSLFASSCFVTMILSIFRVIRIFLIWASAN